MSSESSSTATSDVQLDSSGILDSFHAETAVTSSRVQDILPLVDRLNLVTRQYKDIRFAVNTECVLPSGETDFFSTKRNWGKPAYSIQSSMQSSMMTNSPLEIFEKYEVDKSESKVTKIKVNSATIALALQTCLDSYAKSSSLLAANLHADPIIFHAPFRLLTFCYDRIEKYIQSQSGTLEQRQELNALQAFIAIELRDDLLALEKVRSSGRVSYDSLWTLFPPGQIVVDADPDANACYEVEGYHERANEESTGNGFNPYTVHVLQWNCNGRCFGYIKKELTIPYFKEEASIIELRVSPLDLHAKEQEIREMCVKRGKEWQKILDRHYCSYKGIAKGCRPNKKGYFGSEGDTTAINVYVNSRIMLDAQAYYEAKADQCEPIVKDTQYSVKDFVLTDSQALICPAYAAGYEFEHNRWMHFHVERIKDIQWEDTWERLQIDEAYKRDIETLVQTQSNRDFAPAETSKGLGLIFLLYGPPGSGKTFTVESLSEHLRLPLYAISCGDIESSEYSRDSTFKMIFQNAQRWKAILFFDEADPMLLYDYHRDALLSAFLRRSEFYQGVLFLTTNKEEDFDDAVLNRVHVKIKYMDSSETCASRIWKKHLLARGLDYGAASSLATSLSKEHKLDYRAIGNVLHLADLLAMTDGSRLSKVHIEHAIRLREPDQEKRKSDSLVEKEFQG